MFESWRLRVSEREVHLSIKIFMCLNVLLRLGTNNWKFVNGLRLRQDIVIHASRTKIRYIKYKFSVRHYYSYLHSIFQTCRYQGCEKWMLERAFNGIETVNSLLEWLSLVRWIYFKILIHYVTHCNHYYLSVVTKLFYAKQWFWWGSRKVSIRASNKHSYLFWFSPLGCIAELMKGRIERVLDWGRLSQRSIFV